MVQDAQAGQAQLSDAFSQCGVGSKGIGRVAFDDALDVVRWGDAQAGLFSADGVCYRGDYLDDKAGTVLW